MSKADGGDFILQQEDGDRYRFSPETGQETKPEAEESAAPPVDGYVLVRPSGYSGDLACYDHREGRELWRVDLRSLPPLDGSKNVLVAGGRVWIWAKGGYDLYAVDIRTGEFSAVETERMLKVVRTEEGQLCFAEPRRGSAANSVKWVSICCTTMERERLWKVSDPACFQCVHHVCSPEDGDVSGEGILRF